MTYIDLPNEHTHQLSFYLAMEEWVAMNIDEPECFFMWQVEPSVIIGRNQDLSSEVNVPFCREHSIQIFRRKSGGGCVYADKSNVMFSYITRSDEVQTTFGQYLKMIVDVLKQMGVDATWTDHNDIMIGQKKVSGNAFYYVKPSSGGSSKAGQGSMGRSVVHGTMLYDTDMTNMVGAITPDDEKLVKHGVQSVRQRICFLKDHTTLTLDETKIFFRKNLCDKEVTLSDEDVDGIVDIERAYTSDEWIFNSNPRH